MDKLQAINTLSVADWRCKYIGLKIKDESLALMRHDDEIGLGCLKYELWQRIDDDGTIDWKEKCAWVDLFVCESGINRGRISFIVIEEYEDWATSGLNDHRHDHCRTTRYRNATSEEEKQSKEILSPNVLDDSIEMACHLIGHILREDKMPQLRDYEIVYDKNKDRIDSGLRIEELASIIRCAYNFMEVFFDAHFCEELSWVHGHDHLPMLNMLDAEWFYQGMNIHLKRMLCEDRMIRHMSSYLLLANQSETEMRISLRALLVNRFQGQNQRHLARKVFVLKEDKITQWELLDLDRLHPKSEVVQLLDSIEEGVDNPLLKRFQKRAVMPIVTENMLGEKKHDIDADEETIPF